jgi:hypothetical protein
VKALDYAEPFQAWRVWKVVRRDGGYYLASVVQRAVWPVREAFAAECLRTPKMLGRLRRRQRHDSPELYCDCGIYAAPLGRLEQYLADTPFRLSARVLGQVALWGTVIECEHGYRASHAYPARIYVPADAGGPWRIGWDDVAIGLASYGVPVEPLAARAAEATRHLRDRQAA